MSANTSEIHIGEKHESRQVSRTSGESVCRQQFNILYAKSMKEAEKSLRRHPAPDDIEDFDFKKATVSIDLDPVFFDNTKPQNNIINATRTYNRKNLMETEDAVEWRLTMSTASATVTVAKRAYAAKGSHPFWSEDDYKPGGPLDGQSIGAGSPINVKKAQGKIEVVGVDIQIPSFKLELGFMCSAKKWKRLYPILMKSGGMINQDVFRSGEIEFQPGELMFSGATSQQVEDVTDPDTGETEINYKISYSFDISINEDFVAGEYVIPKEEAAGFSVKWSYFDGEEEIEVEGNDGTKEKILRPLCVGAYASDVYTRTEFAKLIPSGIEL